MQTRCMRNAPNKRGRQVSLRSGAPPTKNVALIQQMKDKIDSKKGREQYSKRSGCVEPVFANIAINKKINYFTLRGKTNVNAQWKMYCLVHNIEKLRNALQ
ncbi:transposase [Ningiella sp. W23]|uniref:transposase n=1 Tax=Ningiella sp. W23 TaxID=3023715 RepID=UPI0039F61276